MSVYSNAFQNDTNPYRGFPMALQELRRFTGKGAMYHFLKHLASRDVIHWRDDFLGLAVDTTNWWAVANSGAGTNLAITVAEGGVGRIVTSATSGATQSAIMPITWSPRRNCGMEIRYKLSVITSVKFEVGFIDAVPASNTGGVNSSDTPTGFATNFALVGFDTSATNNKLSLFTGGNATSQTVVKNVATTTTSPVAAQYQTVRLQLISAADDAHVCQAAFWVDGNLEGLTSIAAGTNDAAVLLAPWLFTKTLTTASKNFDIDYVAVWQDRNTLTGTGT